jgi:hypothetical protein
VITGVSCVAEKFQIINVEFSNPMTYRKIETPPLFYQMAWLSRQGPRWHRASPRHRPLRSRTTHPHGRRVPSFLDDRTTSTLLVSGTRMERGGRDERGMEVTIIHVA